jgi:hypothetical protein
VRFTFLAFGHRVKAEVRAQAAQAQALVVEARRPSVVDVTVRCNLLIGSAGLACDSGRSGAELALAPAQGNSADDVTAPHAWCDRLDTAGGGFA